MESSTTKSPWARSHHSFIQLLEAQTQTDEQRISELLSFLTIHGSVTAVRQCMRKDAKQSQELREEGNKIFISNPLTSNKCLEVFILYSKAIAFAPSPSLELALAYANRSAVLLKVGKYAECITDVENAIKSDYPNKLRGKLYLRKLECFKILNKATFDDILMEIQNWMEKEKLDVKAITEFNHKLETIKNNAKSFLAASNTAISDKNVTLPLPLLVTANKESPCASDAIEIKCSNKFGRHLVATRNIEAGEVIVVEKPYSSVLNFDVVQTYCFHCTKLCWSNIPCRSCTLAMYCSEKCRAADWEASHDIECIILPYMQEPDFDKLNLLAVRTLIYAVRRSGGIEKLKIEVQDVESQSDLRTKGFSSDGIFRSTEYRSVHSLATNTEKRPERSLFLKSFESASILYFLQRHVNEIDDANFKLLHVDDIKFLGTLLIRLKQIIPTNGHSMHQIHGLELVEYGSMLLPFLSLANHSCDPNVSRHVMLGHNILRAIYPIQKGEQIFDHYGQHYALIPKVVRQNALADQYLFQCCCIACEQDWPLFQDIKSHKSFIKDKKIRAKIQGFVKHLASCCDQLLDPNLNIQNVLQLEGGLLEILCELCKHLQRPCKEINNVVEILHRIYDIQNGCFDFSYTEDVSV